MKKRILGLVLGLTMVAVAAVGPLANTAGTVKAAALPTDVTFDDLGTIAGENTVTIEATKVNQTLGEIKSDESGTKNGFSFLMPKAQVGNYIYFGLYNTGTDLYDEGGFVICFGKNASDANAVDYWTYANYPKADGSWGQMGTGSGTVSNLTGDDIKVSVWLEGTNATTGDSLIKILVGDTEITMKESTQQVKIGSYMTVKNDATAAIELKTINPVQNEEDNSGSTDDENKEEDNTTKLIFDDLGTLAGVNTKTINPDKDINRLLGEVKDNAATGTKNGFSVIIPKAQLGNYLWFGLYNNDKAVYNLGGYSLCLGKGASDTEVTYWIYANFQKNDGSWGQYGIGDGKVSNITGDEIKLSAWLEGTNTKTQDQLLNVTIGDTTIVMKQESPHQVKLGSYITVTNNTGAAIDLKTINPVKTTAPATGDGNETLMFAALGVMAALVIAGSTVRDVVLFKKKRA